MNDIKNTEIKSYIDDVYGFTFMNYAIQRKTNYHAVVSILKSRSAAWIKNSYVFLWFRIGSNISAELLNY